MIELDEQQPTLEGGFIITSPPLIDNTEKDLSQDSVTDKNNTSVDTSDHPFDMNEITAETSSDPQIPCS